MKNILITILVVLLPFKGFSQDDCYNFTQTNLAKPKVKPNKSWVGQVDVGVGIPIESNMEGYSLIASSLSASIKPVAGSDWLFTQDWIVQLRGLEGDWEFDKPTPTVSFVFMGLAREFKVKPFDLYLSSGLAIGTSEQRNTSFPAIASFRLKKHISYNVYMKANVYIMLDDAQLNSTTQFVGISIGHYL
jgi:hypothetical protein